MSYRAFKRLLGETSLERKCRFLFGAGTLLLITTIFWWYAKRTEALAYEQTTTTGRLLTNHLLAEAHLKEQPHKERLGIKEREQLLKEQEQLRRALELFADQNLAEETPKYRHRFIKPNARNRENQPDDMYEQGVLDEFMKDREKKEKNRLPDEPVYYGAIRANSQCLNCHARPEEKELYPETWPDKDTMAVDKIR